MELDNNFVYLSWLAALVLIVLRMFRGRPSGGLLLCFWMNFGLNHLFAHFFWDYSGLWLPEKAASDQGFLLTGYAMAGLMAGIVIVDLFVKPRTLPLRLSPSLSDSIPNTLASKALRFGLAVYIIGITGIYAFIPSLSAVASSAAGLAIAAVCLKFCLHHRAGRTTTAWQWAAGILLYPLVGTLVGGFLGYGVSGVMVVACFVLPYGQFRWTTLLLSPLILYFGISFWVTYAAARGEIRGSVWGGKSYENRIEATYKGVVLDWEWFDPYDPKQLGRLERLNQNTLAGSAVQYMERTKVPYGVGDTFTNAVYSIIPRAIWPKKPTYAGSGNLVRQYTGRVFSEGTSVGLGFVMEFYVNFGTWGVAMGFLILGLAVSWLDLTAGTALRESNPIRFLYAFTACQPMMNALGFSAETAPAVIGAVVCVYVFDRVYASKLLPQDGAEA